MTPDAFANYMEDVTAAITHVIRRNDLPDVLSISLADGRDIDDARVRITPWKLGAPLTALVEWAAVVDDPSWSVVVHNPITDDAAPIVSVYVAGTISGLHVEVIGGSWRKLPRVSYDTARGLRQPLDVDAVREVAAAEDPIDFTPEPTS